jgi:hypothetical protein
MDSSHASLTRSVLSSGGTCNPGSQLPMDESTPSFRLSERGSDFRLWHKADLQRRLLFCLLSGVKRTYILAWLRPHRSRLTPTETLAAKFCWDARRDRFGGFNPQTRLGFSSIQENGMTTAMTC